MWKKVRGAACCVFVVLVSGSAIAADTSMQFDLVCDLKGHLVQDNPALPANVRPKKENWDDSGARFIIDLAAMKYCDTDCRTLFVDPIVSVTDKEIVLFDRSGIKDTIRRADNYFYQRNEYYKGLVTELKGFCRKVKFSGIPANAKQRN